jgi:hypothetical protein
MKTGVAILLLAGSFAAPHASFAANKSGVGFQHKDWELACDNTGTCRAAGYQLEDTEPAVSLLLERKAGPKQEVTAQVQLGSYGEEATALSDGVATLAIKVNGRVVGKVDANPATGNFTLSRAAIAAVLPALQQASAVTWSSGKAEWKLSTAGASAVLLKMDEAQGRIGTVGALVRKGKALEDGVPKPVPAPVIIAAAVPKENAKEVLLQPSQQAALLKELRQVSNRDACPGVFTPLPGEEAIALDVHRLSGTKLIVSVTCERYAYNESNGFWVVNARAPFAPADTGVDGNEYDDGEITSSQKGRGLGDCWSSQTWTWDGARFVSTGESTTGLCRLVTPGGAWDLPTYVTTVRKAAPAR